MRYLKVVPCAALAALLAGCGNEPLTPTEEMRTASFSTSGTDRPFKAELEGLATFAPREPGRCRTMDVPFITVGSGTGEGTHLGHFEHSSAHCFENPIGPPPPYGLFERGEWTFVAANGDELYATYEGEQLSPVFEDPTFLTAEVIFVGGTGRFSDASGWAHVEGFVRVPEDWMTEPWPLYQTLEGRISY